MKSNCFYLMIVLVTYACSHTPEQQKIAEVSHPQATRDQATVSIDQDRQQMVIEPGMATLAKIVRNRAELREGPGANFKVKNQLLHQDETVITFNVHGAWYKVLSLSKGHSGWVHFKVLGPSFTNPSPISVSLNQLPTIFSIKPVEMVRTFPRSLPMRVSIPKGQAFLALKMNKGRTLVWSQANNTVFWLNYQDAR